MLVAFKASQLGARRTCCLLSIGTDQGVDLGLVSVIGLLHGPSELVLVGLDIHSQKMCRLSSASSWLTWWPGGLHNDIVAKLVSLLTTTGISNSMD